MMIFDILVIIFLTILIKSLLSKRRRNGLLPPGPTPWPIVGSLPEIWRNKNKPVHRYIHGIMNELNTEIACIRLGNVHVIAVSSPEIAREFLRSTKGLNFLSRPITMATEHLTRGYLSVVLVPMGDDYKRKKKVVTAEITNPARVDQRLFTKKRDEEADNLVRFVYNQCKSSGTGSREIDLRLVVRQYCGNVIRKIMFSKRYFGKGRDDGGPGSEEIEQMDAIFTMLQCIFAFDISDYIPCLRALDLERKEKFVMKVMKDITKYHDPLVDERVQQWNDGKKTKPEEDYLDFLIQAKDSDGKSVLSVEEIKAMCTELTMATVDNPSNAVEWAMAEMINQPDVLQKAVDEIDRVVGKKRWVQEDDLKHLNYVKSCAREAFRLHPVAPFNVPHVSTIDTTVAGYFIPKGSHVLLSRVGLGRNPRVWGDPLKFKPERHLNDGSKVELHEIELRYISFSAGRRGCPGVHLGSIMTTMLLARLVQGFSWSLPPNVAEINLSENIISNIFLANPLHALATPRMPAELYPTTG